MHNFKLIPYSVLGDIMTVGIPKALYYYYFKDFWLEYFKELGIEVVISSDTNKDIIDKGNFYASDEMCLSLKIFLGHIASLQDKCDYLLVPNIRNFGIKDQMCSNYIALYNLIQNLFSFQILDYNIDYVHHKTEKKGLLIIGKKLGFSKKQCEQAYEKAHMQYRQIKQKEILENARKLNISKTKILLVGHPYNMYDPYIGGSIVSYLQKQNCEVIYCDQFDSQSLNLMSKYLSRELYWKYSKENIGSIVLCKEKVDGIIFLTTFPCGLDSLVNELVMRKIDLPYLNLVLDDLDAVAGIETRLESFIDILTQDNE